MEWLALLFLLFLVLRFPGCMVPLFVVAGLGGWLAWHILVTLPRDQEERDRRISEERAAKVQVHVVYDRMVCSHKRWPLSVEIVNGADRTAERIQWKVDAVESGHSTQLVGWAQPLVFDSILPPGGRQGLCVELPQTLKGRHDLANLQYSASGVDAEFQ